jgi:TatD DNase family protein
LNYVDAHLHLADSDYSGLIEEVLDDAAKNGVDYLLSNGMDYDSSVRTLALADQYKNRVLAAVGLHPWTATNTEGKLSLDIFEKLVEENRKMITAIGEIGLDGQYSQDEAKKLRQREVFQFFLRLAERRKLPVIVHSRLAIDEVLNMLPSFTLPKVVLHWYSGPAEYLQQITDQGYLITIGPNILYAKRTVEIARHADLTTILTETDGPVSYFGPFKGKPTRPAFVIDVVKKIAEIKNENIDQIRNRVWDNFQSLTTQRQ